MAFVHGRKADVSINSELLGAFCDKIDLSDDTETVVIKTLNSSSTTVLSGHSSGTLSLSGYYDPTAVTGPIATLDGLNQNDSVPCVYYPGGNVSGQSVATFNAVLKSLKVGSPVAGPSTFAADFEITGAIVWTVHT